MFLIIGLWCCCWQSYHHQAVWNPNFGFIGKLNAHMPTLYFCVSMGNNLGALPQLALSWACCVGRRHVDNMWKRETPPSMSLITGLWCWIHGQVNMHLCLLLAGGIIWSCCLSWLYHRHVVYSEDMWTTDTSSEGDTSPRSSVQQNIIQKCDGCQNLEKIPL